MPLSYTLCTNQLTPLTSPKTSLTTLQHEKLNFQPDNSDAFRAIERQDPNLTKEDIARLQKEEYSFHYLAHSQPLLDNHNWLGVASLTQSNFKAKGDPNPNDVCEAYYTTMNMEQMSPFCHQCLIANIEDAYQLDVNDAAADKCKTLCPLPGRTRKEICQYAQCLWKNSSTFTQECPNQLEVMFGVEVGTQGTVFPPAPVCP